MHRIGNTYQFLLTLLIPFVVCVPNHKYVIEEFDLSRLGDLYEKLDTIIETLNGESTKIGICTKEVVNLTYPKSCADLRLAGATCDGTYVIYPPDLGPVTVSCDMTTDGGGWTVVLRSGDLENKKTSFTRNWEEYKNGFGDSEGEFWLGNEVVHRMTMVEEDMELRIFRRRAKLHRIYSQAFEFFTVENETSFYKLKCYDPKENVTYNIPFKTHDLKDKNSSKYFITGWWYNITGDGYTTLGHEIKTLAIFFETKMMFRPQNFTLNDNLRKFMSLQGSLGQF